MDRDRDRDRGGRQVKRLKTSSSSSSSDTRQHQHSSSTSGSTSREPKEEKPSVHDEQKPPNRKEIFEVGTRVDYLNLKHASVH